MPQAAMLELADMGGTITTKGPLQTQTKGDKQYLWVVAFTHNAACEIDPKTGLPKTAGLVGKKTIVRQSEFVITKKLDYTTPLLHKAYLNGTVLTPWKLNLWQLPMSGGANNYFTIHLTGAKIRFIRTIKPAMFTPAAGQAHEVEEVGFSYATIKFEALAAPRGLDHGNAPPGEHEYPGKIEPDWKWQKAKALGEKLYGIVSDKIKDEMKARLVAEGILTADGHPGANFNK